jgi:hypothetical protein
MVIVRRDPRSLTSSLGVNKIEGNRLLGLANRSKFSEFDSCRDMDLFNLEAVSVVSIHSCTTTARKKRTTIHHYGKGMMRLPDSLRKVNIV